MCERDIAPSPLTSPLDHSPGTWPATQACALTRSRTSNLSVCEMMPNPLNYTSQGYTTLLPVIYALILREH